MRRRLARRGSYHAGLQGEQAAGYPGAAGGLGADDRRSTFGNSGSTTAHSSSLTSHGFDRATRGPPQSESSPPRQRRGDDEHGGTGVEEQGSRGFRFRVGSPQPHRAPPVRLGPPRRYSPGDRA